jgi:hypothetical protein
VEFVYIKCSQLPSQLVITMLEYRAVNRSVSSEAAQTEL